MALQDGELAWEPPTQLLLRTLRLPASLAERVDRFRRTPSGIMEMRRNWVLETLSIFLLIANLVVLPVEVIQSGWRSWADTWLLGFFENAFGLGLIIRGHTNLVVRVSIVTGLVYPVVSATNPDLALIHTFSGSVFALVMAAMLERTAITLAVSVAGVCAILVTGQLHGDPLRVAETLAALFVILSSLALTGGRTSVVLFNHLQRGAERNRQLTVELLDANASLEQANADLARSNADLESRVRQRTQALEEMSVRDELTGLYNRRHFTTEMASERLRTRRVAMLMVDVDHFKSVNDTLGHSVGDVVLRRVGASLRRQVRGEDFVARIGGEEFVAVLTDRDLDAAMALAERLRTGIESLAWHDIPVPHQRVTASIGVCVREVHDATDVQQLMHDADQALYSAKRQGRNRIVAAADADLTTAVQ